MLARTAHGPAVGPARSPSVGAGRPVDTLVLTIRADGAAAGAARAGAGWPLAELDARPAEVDAGVPRRRRPRGPAGAVHTLPGPARTPGHGCCCVGVGAGDEAGWRAAGAALARAAGERDRASRCALPGRRRRRPSAALAEGPGSRRTGSGSAPTPAERAPQAAPRSTLRGRRRRGAADAADAAPGAPAPWPTRSVLARDLTNTPSAAEDARTGSPTRSPTRPPGRTGVHRHRCATESELAARGLRRHPRRRRRLGPRRRAWSSWPGGPRGARPHVVLVGKGITFDTGGISHQAAATA